MYSRDSAINAMPRHDHLHELLYLCWEEWQLPHDMHDANIITLRNNSDQNNCNNYIGISLLSVIWKVFPEMHQRCFINLLSESTQSQCSLRAAKSTGITIFMVKQLQKNREHMQLTPVYCFCRYDQSFDDINHKGQSCADCCFDVMISIFTRLLWISLIHVTIISFMWHACFMFYVIITNTMAYWYDGAALAAKRSPVIALFWCLIKFTTTTTTTRSLQAPWSDRMSSKPDKCDFKLPWGNEEWFYNMMALPSRLFHNKQGKTGGNPPTTLFGIFFPTLFWSRWSRRKSDCCWVEMNLATLTYWGHYQIAAGLRWIWPPSLVGDTTRLLLSWGESGHLHLLGTLPDCCWVEVNLATLTCWGHYQIAAGLRWIWPPSLVGDTTRLLLGWDESGHPHLLGTLPDCCWVEVNLATLTCWGHYQIAAGLRWIWPPSLVGDTTRLLLGWDESGHPHLLGTLPDCCWVEMNLATLTYWGHYHILNIGVSLSLYCCHTAWAHQKMVSSSIYIHMADYST